MQRAWSRKNLWEAMPPAVKSALGSVLGRVPPAMWLGRRFRESLAFVNEAQWWSAERARDYQLRQVQRICRLAVEETTYYQTRFQEIGFEPGDLKSLEDLARLPTIDKNTIRGHLNDMCTASPESRGTDMVTTGGSSGEPLNFYINSGRSAVEYAYLVAGWQRMGYQMDVPQAVFRGQVVPENRSGMRHYYDPVLRRHYYSNFHMSEENIRRYLEHVASIGPCFLHVYPSSASTLARFVQRNNFPRLPNVRGILAGSEMVYPEIRAEAEEAFGARFFSWYGHSEKLVLAAECEESSAYHVWPTYGYFELLDERGEPVTERGRIGEIVGTGFINTVAPFIRYRTGDYAVYGSGRCDHCGREHTILDEIKGRWPQGGLYAKDGSIISMTAFNVHDDTFLDTIGYQFHQTVPGKATLRVVPARPLEEADRRRILNGATRRLQGQVDISLEIRDALDQTPAGKLLRVVTTLTHAAEEDVETSRPELQHR